MQLLARLVDHALKARGQRATIIGATSGDTGAAAIEAFSRPRAGRCVHPLSARPRLRRAAPPDDDGRRRQHSRHRHRRLVRRRASRGQGAFRQQDACARSSISAASTRSTGRASSPRPSIISPARSRSARRIGRCPSSRRPAISATSSPAMIAKRMGLPIERLVIATNANDILPRALASGTYAVGAVHATQSPSMDIQVSSNFERLLFEAYGRDGAAVRAKMAQLAAVARASHIEAAAARRDPRRVRRLQRQRGANQRTRSQGSGARRAILLDPHTRGRRRRGAARSGSARERTTPLIVLGTAHAGEIPRRDRGRDRRCARPCRRILPVFIERPRAFFTAAQ